MKVVWTVSDIMVGKRRELRITLKTCIFAIFSNSSCPVLFHVRHNVDVQSLMFESVVAKPSSRAIS